MQLTARQRASLSGVAQNREHMRRTGFTYAGDRLWTTHAVGIIHHHGANYAALMEALPGRTRRAIEHKVQRLGLARPRKVWCPGEFPPVAKLYKTDAPIQLVADVAPNKTLKQIYAKAWRERVRRPKRLPKPTGNPLIDAIRLRAHVLNFTMSELEAAAGSKLLTRAGAVRWGAVVKAVDALGGRFDVRWPI